MTGTLPHFTLRWGGIRTYSKQWFISHAAVESLISSSVAPGPSQSVCVYGCVCSLNGHIFPWGASVSLASVYFLTLFAVIGHNVETRYRNPCSLRVSQQSGDVPLGCDRLLCFY